MPDDSVIIVDGDGNRHVFPAGFDPKRAAQIVRTGAQGGVGSQLQSMSRGREGSLVDAGIDALPMIGGAVGGILGATTGIPTAGLTSGPGAIAGAGILGAGGEAAKQWINYARGKEVPTTEGEMMKGIGTEGATQAALEGFGQAIGAGAKWAGRGLYRKAAGPINQVLDKYGDIVGAGIRNRIPISEGGYTEAQQLASDAIANKSAAMAKADKLAAQQMPGTSPSLPVIMRDTRDALVPHAEASRAAGYGDPSGAWRARSDRILKENNWFPLPSEAEGIKHTVDDQLGPAYRKLRNKEALLPNERYDLNLSQTIGDSQSRLVPGYDKMNDDIMDAVGLGKVIKRRVMGSGANQGLETLAALTMLGSGAGVGATAATRAAALPPIMSRMGIGTHMVGEHPQAVANALRAAVLALMSSHSTPQK